MILFDQDLKPERIAELFLTKKESALLLYGLAIRSGLPIPFTLNVYKNMVTLLSVESPCFNLEAVLKPLPSAKSRDYWFRSRRKKRSLAALNEYFFNEELDNKITLQQGERVLKQLLSTLYLALLP